jgi:hypothetical protein
MGFEKKKTMSKQPSGSINRIQWLTIFETASQTLPSEMNDHWGWLMDQLGLPYDCFPAVLLALEQGRWRKAKNPKAYVKTVARRETKNLEPVPADVGIVSLVKQPADGRAFSFDDASDRLMQGSSSETSKRKDGVWRRGSGASDEHHDDNPREGVSFRDFLLSYVPENLKLTEPPSAEYKALIDDLNRESPHYYQARSSTCLDWDHWTAVAGFNPWERLVLDCKLNEVSRDQALSRQLNETDRKALQAAWRRFDRTGMSRLRAAAEKSLIKNVPE